ncbi:elongator complex protein 5-like [Pomacea canaliculata]|uniref:elongator complex protein 5-like n=1 Tax=Pomacea canaliculata TaxID=400727 RepID=UPI000D72BECF|nr:elongator complex protein 5-like [Pomacea canaliculata]
MLQYLLSGIAQSRIIMIEDNEENPGRQLVIAFLQNLCQRCDMVLLLAYERPAEFFIRLLPEELTKRILVIDVMKNWCDCCGTSQTAYHIITNMLSRITGEEQRLGVVIDSVTILAQGHSPALVPQVLHSFANLNEKGNTVQQVVALVHSDVHDEATIKVIQSRVPTIIHLRPSSTHHHMHGCVIQHSELWKKSTEWEEDFNINERFQVTDVSAVVKKKLPSSIATEKQSDPTANLTFNLTLRPEEKAAKDQVVLPYTSVTSSEKNPGQIFYIPDDADDFDDEDPDDDLDF